MTIINTIERYFYETFITPNSVLYIKHFKSYPKSYFQCYPSIHLWEDGNNPILYFLQNLHSLNGGEGSINPDRDGIPLSDTAGRALRP